MRRSITPQTRVLYMESPVNPTLRLTDLKAVADIAREINATRPDKDRMYTVVDSTFATPFCQRPITLGIDFVVHSLTKAIGGFGTDIGGVVIGPQWSQDMLMLYRKDFGGVLSPKSAWPVLVQGLPSLAVRMRQMQQTAMTVAQFLTTRREIACVRYPGLPQFAQTELARRQMVDYDGNFAPGAMIYFVMKGEKPADALKHAECFINHVARNFVLHHAGREPRQHPHADRTSRLHDAFGDSRRKNRSPRGSIPEESGWRSDWKSPRTSSAIWRHP